MVVEYMDAEGTWSSLVYGARFENEYLNKVVIIIINYL